MLGESSSANTVICRSPGFGLISQKWVKTGNSSSRDSAVSTASPRADRPYCISLPTARK